MSTPLFLLIALPFRNYGIVANIVTRTPGILGWNTGKLRQRRLQHFHGRRVFLISLQYYAAPLIGLFNITFQQKHRLH